MLELLDKSFVYTYHLNIFTAFHGLDEDSSAVNANHDHIIFVAGKIACWEFPGLV